MFRTFYIRRYRIEEDEKRIRDWCLLNKKEIVSSVTTRYKNSDDINEVTVQVKDVEQ